MCSVWPKSICKFELIQRNKRERIKLRREPVFGFGRLFLNKEQHFIDVVKFSSVIFDFVSRCPRLISNGVDVRIKRIFYGLFYSTFKAL